MLGWVKFLLPCEGVSLSHLLAKQGFYTHTGIYIQCIEYMQSICSLLEVSYDVKASEVTPCCKENLKYCWEM